MLEREREEKWRQVEALCLEREGKLTASLTTEKTSLEKETVQEVATTGAVMEENKNNGSDIPPESHMEEGGEEVGTESDVCDKSET